ncbi:hypothetical protein [Corynebacterium hindlerae]|uniref:hypothetical protein n=1 Tax=Corynebacterium hindlerae TaxID=699041 RepID=UPI0031B6FAC4
MTQPQGAWLESITLFQQLRDGDFVGAHRLLTSASDPTATLHGIARMFHVFLQSEPPTKLDHFMDTARTMAPPPPLHTPQQHIPAARPELRIVPSLSTLLHTHCALIAGTTRAGTPFVLHDPYLEATTDSTLTFSATSPLARQLPSCGTVEVVFRDNAHTTDFRFTGRLTGYTIELIDAHPHPTGDPQR